MNQTMKYWKQAVAGALCLLTLAGCAGQSGGGTMSQPESSSELSLGDGPIRIVRSDKNPLPWQSETTYEYLGLRFFLPEEFQAGIEDGSLYLQREALYNSDDKTRDQFYYAYQYLQYIPEDCEDMEYAVDWNAWLDTTERIGAVGAYRADYLEEHPIETITGCSENKEIGRSEDGQLIYYISVAAEDHAELGELWQSMEVELIEVSPYVQAPDCPDFFDVFDTARNLDALNFLGDFHAQDLDGNSVDTSVFHDYKLTMVNVMTTWCSSCIAEMYKAMKYLYGRGLALSTALITDGRFSGTNNGCFVGHISPEASEGGPIALVRDGDRIVINVEQRSLNVLVSDEELAARKTAWKAPEPKFTRGWLGLYCKLAGSGAEGAVLDMKKLKEL